jgi:hypothetical protein
MSQIEVLSSKIYFPVCNQSKFASLSIMAINWTPPQLAHQFMPALEKLRLLQHSQLDFNIEKFLAEFLFKSLGIYRYQSYIKKPQFKATSQF